MPHISVPDIGAGFHLNAGHSAIRCLDDHLHLGQLTVPVVQYSGPRARPTQLPDQLGHHEAFEYGAIRALRNLRPGKGIGVHSAQCDRHARISEDDLGCADLALRQVRGPGRDPAYEEHG